MLGRRCAFLHGLDEESPLSTNRPFEETDEFRLIEERLLGVFIVSSDDDREFQRTGMLTTPKYLVVFKAKAGNVALIFDENRIVASLETYFLSVAEAVTLKGTPSKSRSLLHFINA